MNNILHTIFFKLQRGAVFEALFDNILEKIKYNKHFERKKYRQLINQKRRLHYYKKLKNQFGKVLINHAQSIRQKDKELDHIGEKIVWFCWFQGIENAPEIVKCCYVSQKKIVDEMGEWKLVLVDHDYISKNVQFPSYVMKKYERGIITNAHFSDLLRLELLVKHGGIWIDATVFLTDSWLLKKISKEKIFMVSQWYYFSGEIMTNDNWLIVSEKNNRMLLLLERLLLEYWKTYDYALDYFIFHLFWTMVRETFNEDAKKIPVYSKHVCDQLATILFSQYDEKMVDYILHQSGVHKLSYKYDALKKQNELENTVYDVIVRKNES